MRVLCLVVAALGCATHARPVHVQPHRAQPPPSAAWNLDDCAALSERARAERSVPDVSESVVQALVQCGDFAAAYTQLHPSLAPATQCTLGAEIARRQARSNLPAAEVHLRDASRAGCGTATLLLSDLLRRHPDRTEDALAWAREAVVQAGSAPLPERAAAFVALARALGSTGGASRAEVACRHALQLDRSRAASWHGCGVVALDAGDIELALTRFQRAYTLDPELIDAWVAHGEVALAHRDFEEAARLFGEALSREPAHYPALVERGIALRALGAVNDSRAHYQRAIAASPDRPEAWFDLALALESTGELEEAARAYEAFLERAPAAMSEERRRAERFLAAQPR